MPHRAARISAMPEISTNSVSCLSINSSDVAISISVDDSVGEIEAWRFPQALKGAPAGLYRLRGPAQMSIG